MQFKENLKMSLQKESTERLFIFLGNYDSKRNPFVKVAMEILEDLDTQISDHIDEYEKLEVLYNEKEDEIKHLEEEAEEVQNLHYCENVQDCPFEGDPPDLKSLGDINRFNEKMEEL